ncbi:MAG: TetR family transcriptional regulator [Labedaea sp.]
MDGTPGLRERKKQATREALSWAALRLAVQHGFDNVLVEDIAAGAGVSPRTFNNYFSSKAEAIVWRHLDRVRQFGAALRARPPGEPLWPAIIHAALEPLNDNQHVDAPNPEWTAGARLVINEPALIGEYLKAGAIAEAELAEAIAERTGTHPTQDLYPQLVAAVVNAVTTTANRLWLNADPPMPLLPLLRDALQQVASGLPEPTST